MNSETTQSSNNNATNNGNSPKGESSTERGGSLLSTSEVMELFKAIYLPMRRAQALDELKINERLFCDFVAGRRNVHKCKKVLRAMKLEPVEMFTRNGKDK